MAQGDAALLSFIMALVLALIFAAALIALEGVFDAAARGARVEPAGAARAEKSRSGGYDPSFT